jgi:hypothetical protein
LERERALDDNSRKSPSATRFRRMPMPDIETLRRILATNRVIAVVGLSADWYRPSYFAAKYMQEHGYRIIPVNPKYERILGERCHASLADIPDKVDIVDVFRRTRTCRRSRVRPSTSARRCCGSSSAWSTRRPTGWRASTGSTR